MKNLLEAAWRSQAKRHSSNPAACDHLHEGVARAFLELRQEGEVLSFCYGDLSRMIGESEEPLPNSWLLGLARSDHSHQRAIVLETGREPRILWESPGPLRTSRTRGMFLDDAAIAGGQWLDPAAANGIKGNLVVSGSLRGGRFRTYFKELLAISEPLPD
jgi:hypothetical protein